jgi:ATP-binding cassette subfamily F protein uup
VLVFEQGGKVTEYLGGYSDWVKRGKLLMESDVPDELNRPAKSMADSADKDNKQKKLSYKLQRELDELPSNIEKLENDIDFLQVQIAQPEFYDQDFTETRDVLDLLSSKQDELDRAMLRWSELEDM